MTVATTADRDRNAHRIAVVRSIKLDHNLGLDSFDFAVG